MVFLTFFGEVKTHVHHPPHKLIHIPLIVLAVLSLIGGFIELPHTFGHFTLFSDFLNPVLPEIELKAGIEHSEWLIQLLAAGIALSGIYIAYYFFILKPEKADKVKSSFASLHQFWFSGWGFDVLYHTLFVRPFVWVAEINKNDAIDKVYEALVSITNYFHRLFASSHSGLLRWYIMGIVVGAILVLTIGLFL
jgi:NADH-quinone oxidoreductase subunit L